MLLDTYTYGLTLAVGLPLVCLVWVAAYRMRLNQWPWRASISALLAVCVAPTFYSPRGEPWVFPAVWMLRTLGWGFPPPFVTCLCFGIAPIAFTAVLVFMVWTFLSRRLNARISRNA